MKIARVFPRRTKATPTDELTFIGPPPLYIPEIDEVHISVAFTYDMPQAEYLAKCWERVGVPVRMGGPAFNEPGGEFIPGRYLKQGYVITSRGCPNRCWFCSVPKREGYAIRELPIHDGWNVLDDNLLACSDDHIKAVFEMLGRQKERALFTGGLEAKILKPWHTELIHKLKPERMYFAYDTPDDYEPLVQAGKLLQDAEISKSSMYCYVLVGYPHDTFGKADKRLRDTVDAGYRPMAMLYRNENGETSQEWRDFQRLWARPAIVYARAMGGRKESKYHQMEVRCENSIQKQSIHGQAAIRGF